MEALLPWTGSQSTCPSPEPGGSHPQVPGCLAPVAPSGLGEGRGERGKEKERKDEHDEGEIAGEVIGNQRVESSMTKGGVGGGSQSETDKLL